MGIKIKETGKIKGVVDVFVRTRENGKWGRWKLNETTENLIVNAGYNSLIAGLFTVSGLTAVNFDSFGVSNGTVVPALTRVATDFDADGTTFRKAIQSTSFDVTTRTLVVTCYLSSSDNTVTSITKFGIFDQTSAGGTMWNEVKFSTAKTKNTDIEIYFYYRLILEQT